MYKSRYFRLRQDPIIHTRLEKIKYTIQVPVTAPILATFQNIKVEMQVGRNIKLQLFPSQSTIFQPTSITLSLGIAKKFIAGALTFHMNLVRIIFTQDWAKKKNISLKKCPSSKMQWTKVINCNKFLVENIIRQLFSMFPTKTQNKMKKRLFTLNRSVRNLKNNTMIAHQSNSTPGASPNPTSSPSTALISYHIPFSPLAPSIILTKFIAKATSIQPFATAKCIAGAATSSPDSASLSPPRSCRN